MQSPRRAGVFSRMSQSLGLSKGSKDFRRESNPQTPTGPRRPPIGGGRHEDEDDSLPYSQTQQASQIQDPSSSQAGPSQSASEFAEIQPAGASEDASNETVFAPGYKNNAISKLMAETTGPSTTVPPSRDAEVTRPAETDSSANTQHQPGSQVSQAPAASSVSQTQSTAAPVSSERVQNVSGFDSTGETALPAGHNMTTGGFRSSSGVPSEDELNQLYTNSSTQAQGQTVDSHGSVDTATGDLPDNTNIGFSGKGKGIYGAFATPERSTRPAASSQAAETVQAETAAPAQLPLPESAETRTHYQPVGVTAAGSAPFTAPTATPSQGEAPQHQEAQPDSLGQAVSVADRPAETHAAGSAASQHTNVPEQLAASQPYLEETPASGDQVTVPPPRQIGVPASQAGYQGARVQSIPFDFGIPAEFDPTTHVYIPGPISSPTPTVPTSAAPTPTPTSTAPSSGPQESTFQLDPPQAHPTFSPAPSATPASELNEFPKEIVSYKNEDSAAGLGVETSGQAIASGEGQPPSLEGQQERQAVPTETSNVPQAAHQDGKPSGQGNGTQALAEGAEQYPATPDRFNRAPQPASPEDIQSLSSAPHSSAAHSSAHPHSQVVSHGADFSSQVTDQEQPVSANSGAAGIPNYPRENPLFDEDQLQQQEIEPEAAPEPVFHDNPEFDQSGTTHQSSFGRGLDQPHNPHQRQNEAYESAPVTDTQTATEHVHETEHAHVPHEHDSRTSAGPAGPAGPAGGEYIEEPRASEAVTAAKDAVEREVLGSRSVHPEATQTVSNAADDGAVKDEITTSVAEQAAPVGRVTSRPQLSGIQQQVVPEHLPQQERVLQQETVAAPVEQERSLTSEPEIEEAETSAGVSQATETETGAGAGVGVTETGAGVDSYTEQPTHTNAQSAVENFVPPPSDDVIREAELPATYTGPQIVSKDADLTPVPPSAAWGPATGVTSYTAPTQGASYAPPVQSHTPSTQEAVVVEQPAVETEEALVDQDPPTDLTVDRGSPVDTSVTTAEPALPVSTLTGTGRLTSTPQLGPALPGAVPENGPAGTTEAAVETEIAAVTPAEPEPDFTNTTTEQPVVAAPTAPTREEIVSYRPAQDPAFDPSQGQGSVPVSTVITPEERPPPRPPVMTPQEIAAYRSAEDPAYDPVERRGWWDVDVAGGAGTILPSSNRGGQRGFRGGARGPRPTLTGPHIHAGGDPSQATHFGSIVSGGRGRGGPVGGAPGVYDAPPLASQEQSSRGVGGGSDIPLTPSPTPVAPLGEGAIRQVPVRQTGGPSQDPVYDPTEGAIGNALPSAGNDQIDNPLYEEQQLEDISGTEYDQVETVPGQKDVIHRGEQAGTPQFAQRQQQQPAAFTPTAERRNRAVATGVADLPSIASRRAARTISLTNIGRPAPIPQQAYAPPEPVAPKPEYELGAADVLPQDEHYVKPTTYDELGPNARSALSGAGWKTTWALEMEAGARRGTQDLKYPVGPVVPQGASGFAPKGQGISGFAPKNQALGVEPDYAALARGEPGFPTAPAGGVPPLGPSGSSAVDNLPPSITGATAGLDQDIGGEQGYLQHPAPPVHPGAPVVDSGFTGPGGYRGGARRRLAGRLFERQHSLQDPSFDPVSQRFGKEEGYGVELPAHKPPGLPTGRPAPGFDQGAVTGPSRGTRASSVAGLAPGPAQYEDDNIPEQIQEEPVPVVDKTKEMNERLLVEVRKRLQAAKSQLNTQAPSEGDVGTPVDSPLGGRPTVLHGRDAPGSGGQGYWRTLEEVEAEGSNPISREAPSPWVQTRGPELAPRRLFDSGAASGGYAQPHMRTGIVPMSSGRVPNKGLQGFGAGRVHNIAGGYPNRRSRGGNQYSWGREGVY